jgi:isocitrate dehydrogenase kinase/phosphatase
MGDLIAEAQRAVLDDFSAYYAEFEEIMARSKERFERRDWAGLQGDADARLSLYQRAIAGSFERIESILGDLAGDAEVWRRLQEGYKALTADPALGDLARAYFATVKRRFIPAEARDFLGEPEGVPEQGTLLEEVRILEAPGGPNPIEVLLRAVLALFPFQTPYEDLEEDVRTWAMLIEEPLADMGVRRPVAVLRPLFYRGNQAHIVGRVWSAGRYQPVVIALTNSERGIRIKEVLIGEERTSSLFSFTRAPFHVVTAHHRELMSFVRSLSPAKSPADLYASVGYLNLAKSALLRDLFRLLVEGGERFRASAGANGTVMLAFELPGSRFVIKIIRDHFLPRRVDTSREKVMNRYRFVQHAPRAGRILDIMHFHHVRFERSWFEEALLAELLASAPSTVQAEGPHVHLTEFYAQRKVVPLDLILRTESDPELLRRLVLDFGFLHKELAARNIFTGDVVPNNFGAVSIGRQTMRLVSFDYDGYSRVSDLNFLALPSARSFDIYDDWAAPEESMVIDEEWDVIPEKLRITLGIPASLQEEFDRVHGELYSTEYWVELQRRLRSQPELVDAFPFPMLARRR